MVNKKIFFILRALGALAEELISFFLKITSLIFLFSPIRFCFAKALYWLLKKIHFRKKVIQENLERIKIFDPKTEDAFYHQFSHLLAEMFFNFGSMRYFVKKNVTFEGAEWIEKALEKKKGIIFIVSHLGNWEVMTAAGSLLGKVPILMVTKKLKPAWFHRLIEKNRKKSDVSATYEPRTMKDILLQLKKNQAVGIIIDQYLGPPLGIRVPFFGTNVGTSGLAAALVRKTHATPLFAYNVRLANGSFHVKVCPITDWITTQDVHHDIFTNTQKTVTLLEEQIKNHPTQWLWSHKRFKGDLS
jgi:KDO2-lipid IV(A) lauroyltransferase